MIPEHKIDEVRERVDLVALVQRHGVELKKSGRSYRGLCPFHQEKSPSFYVWAETRRFKCFGCQAGGDAISFVQRLLGKPFVDTVRDLAKELGIDLEAAVDPAMREKQQLKDATDFAAQHFQQRLWDPAVGHHAREYLRSRGLTDELMRAFGLGWAPMAWTDLADRLREQGLLAFGEKAGLVAPRQKGDGFYDTFRGRVMIPIRSPEGRTIAFGGRLLEGDDGPKYLNSKESRLYNKSEVLYATDQARDDIRKRKSAVLCEGYFDAIGLHQAGVKNAVALCSTALTPGHLGLLSRLEAKELVLLLDGDEAGRKAVERLAGAILGGGQAARVAVLPEGEDPDTFAKKAGAEAVQQLVKQARPLTEHLFRTLLPDGPGASFEDKMGALDRLKPVAAQVPVGLVRSALFGAMAKHFGIPASELEAALRSRPPQATRPAPKGGPVEPRPDQIEALYVACVVRDRQLLGRDEHRCFDELKHLGLRSLVAAVQSGSPPEDALFEASEGVKTALTTADDQLPGANQPLEPAFQAIGRRIKLRSIEEQLARIARETAQTPGASELTADARTLLEQRGQLLALKQRLLSQRDHGGR
ncbi:MAG: DNA primase [Myxococcaceae bacterium]|nr:DNA primase [Myxococcaceae bacterium]MCA3016643.1 DNA primase [Myxococcaceae bacterium]